MNMNKEKGIDDTCTVKPVYKDHSMEPEHVAFMSSCPLYAG
jgi:hypothetical protein